MAGMEQANVFRVTLDQDTVSLAVGICQPVDMVEGQIPDEAVQELDRISFPASMLSGILKQLIEAGTLYQEERGDIGLEIDKGEDGYTTVRI